MEKRILIFGATSAIAIACARIWAHDASYLVLVGRTREKLIAVSEDLSVRGASSVEILEMDATDTQSHDSIIKTAFKILGKIDIALIAHGTLPNQSKCQADLNLTIQEFHINCVSVLSLLTVLANQFEQQQCGSIAVITSVAGDRGRPSNYVYGSSKAAVSTFCEGLRARLHKSKVSLTDIRPGFVNTPMTSSLSLPSYLTATPDFVAKRITRSIDAKTDVVYVPTFWRIFMMLIRNIPGAIFKRMSL